MFLSLTVIVHIVLRFKGIEENEVERTWKAKDFILKAEFREVGEVYKSFH